MRWNRRSFTPGRDLAVALLLASLVLLLRTAHASAQTPVSSVNPSGTVVVAGAGYNNPPYHFMAPSGEPAGFDIELLKAVAEAAGFEIRLKMGSPEEAFASLRRGELSMIAGVFQTSEIEASADFCTPYLLVSYSLFAGKQSQISSLDNVKGKSIVVRRGEGMDMFAQTNSPADKIASVETYEDALRLVAFGHYDCALLPTDMGHHIAEESGLADLVECTGRPVYRSGYGFVVAKGAKGLLGQLDQGLSRVITSGKYKELEAKWLTGYTEPQGRTAWFLLHNKKTLVATVLALLVMVTAALLLIRHQVSSRTAELKERIRQFEQTTSSLAAEKQSLAALLWSAPYGAIVLADWDWDSEILYGNQAFGELFGYELEETPTMRSLADKILPDEDYRSRVHSRWKSLGEQGLTRSGFTLAVSTRDGKKKHVDFLASPVGDGRVIVLFADVTEKELQEEERQRIDEQIRQSQKLEAMGQLAGGVSHDLNNLLAPILGNAQLLLMELGDDKERSVLAQEIVSAARRAGELTKQLLAYARKGKFQVIPVDIHRSIHEIISLLQRSIDKLIEVKEDLQAARPVIMGDPSQIHGALLNLGVNARDAMPNGGKLIFSTRMVTVDKEACRRLSHDITPGEYLEIGVSDSGTGMTKEVRQRLFEPFFTTKQIGKGTGLGLAAVFGCVKNHHGTITVSSEPGKGTTFSILLPAVGKTAEEEPKETSFAHGSGHILVVDDEETVRRFLGRTLERLGYRVSLCQDGVSAVEFFKSHHQEIDLVLLDMIMPNLDGKGAFTQLKKIDPDVRVLIVSGYSADKTAVECMRLGALGFIAKPCQIDELARSVALCMQSGKNQSQAILT